MLERFRPKAGFGGHPRRGLGLDAPASRGRQGPPAGSLVAEGSRAHGGLLSLPPFADLPLAH